MTSTVFGSPIPYIDAHHHIWAPRTRGSEIGYVWLRDIGAPKPFGDPTSIQRDYLMAEFLAETSEPPRASVHVQTDGALPDPVAETAFVQAQADAAGHPVAIVGLADLGAPNLDELLTRHAQYPGFRGVRQIVARLEDRPELSFSPRDLLTEKQWLDGLKRIESRGLTFDLQLYPEQAEAAMQALSAVPALTVIIDHALSPHDASEAGLARWKAAVSLMATRPRTYIKLSGFGMFRRDWTKGGADAFGPHIAHILAEFGAARVMWGSNYPVEKLTAPYEACLQTVLAHIPEPDHETVLYRSVIDSYDLKLT